MITKTLKRINHSNFRAAKKTPDLIHIQYKRDTVSTMEDLTASYNAFKDLGGGKRVNVLTEIKDHAYFDIESSHCLTETDLWPSKEAIVTKSLAARLSMSALYKNKTYHQLKVFRKKSNALKWLLAEQ